VENILNNIGPQKERLKVKKKKARRWVGLSQG
jgi:hypothetical protein